jgi:hypothetical protein
MTTATDGTSINRVPVELVAAFLVDEGWPCEQLGDKPILRTGYKGSNGQWNCYAHCRAEYDQVLFYSIAPQSAPEASRPGVAEYLTRANWGLMIGNFELDYGDGEVRYKTSAQFEQTDLTADLLRPLVYGNVVMMEKYLPGLQAVIAQSQTPVEAIQALETHGS